MTDQERQLIENLIQRVQSAPPPQIDRDADELIRRGIGSRPDALYILVQSVLIQEMALNQAKAQIAQLQGGSPQSSFLGGAPAPSGSGYQSSRYQRESQPAAPAPSPRYEYVQEQPRSRFSDFFHNAAQTAAGIVAGEVAFSALSSLFGHHGGSFGAYGGGFESGSGFLGGGGGETIVNNYYEGERNERALEPGLSPDLEDRRFAGSDDLTDSGDTAEIGTADDAFLDDTSMNDDTSDDASSYDDGSDV